MVYGQMKNCTKKAYKYEVFPAHIFVGGANHTRSLDYFRQDKCHILAQRSKRTDSNSVKRLTYLQPHHKRVFLSSKFSLIEPSLRTLQGNFLHRIYPAKGPLTGYQPVCSTNSVCVLYNTQNELSKLWSSMYCGK